MISVLIAGEDAAKRAKLASPLLSQGYHIIEAESGARTYDLLKRRQTVALALIDVEMADISGVDFIGNIRAGGAKIPVIALAGNEDDERLRRAVAAGADDFLVYPVSSARLSVSVGNLLQKRLLQQHGASRLSKQGKRLPKAVSQWQSSGVAMQKVLAEARNAAVSGGILLICGEPNTGRLRLAHAIHLESNLHDHDTDAPFVFVKCGGKDGAADLPNNAELEQKALAAQGGTLCFGIVDMLDKAGQAQFLHFIERQAAQGCIAVREQKDKSHHAGSGAGNGESRSDPHKKSFRLTAIASNDLQDLVEEGSFSTGLYKKLTAQRVLHIPPLRKRKEDMDSVAHHILARLVGETRHSSVNGISGAAMTLLTEHNWPGNFAELENILFRAVLLSNGHLLVSRDFPQLAGAGEDNDHNRAKDKNASLQVFYEISGHIKPLAEIEKTAILEAMKRYRGKISEVARRLKIGRSTLYRKLEDYGLYTPSDGDHARKP